VSSTELRADDLLLKAGEMVTVTLVGGGEATFKVKNIKGKWIEGEIPIGSSSRYNSDYFTSVLRYASQ